MDRGGGSDIRAFQLALTDPFGPGAIGARVCDSYVIPTATYHIRNSLTCFASGAGTFSCIVFPSPCLTFYNFVGTSSGLTGFTQNALCSYAVSPTTLANTLTEYRTVSWGLRLLAKDTAFASKGKVFIAPVPTTENAPSWNTFETVTGTAAAVGEYTVGVDPTYVPQGIAGMPGVRTFSMQDLLRGEVQAIGTPTNAAFYQFKGTADRSNMAWNTGQVLADEGVFNSTTGLVNATAGGRKDIASLRGGRAFIIHATGLPVSANEFDIELIFHLEGTPNCSGASGLANGGLIPSSLRSTNGSTGLIEKVIAMATKAQNIVRFIKDPVNVASATRAVAFLAGV